MALSGLNEFSVALKDLLMNPLLSMFDENSCYPSPKFPDVDYNADVEFVFF